MAGELLHDPEDHQQIRQIAHQVKDETIHGHESLTDLTLFGYIDCSRELQLCGYRKGISMEPLM